MRTLTHIVGSTGLAFAIAAFASAQGMTLKQLAELRNIGEAAIRPDGDLIAYTRTVPRTLVTEEDGGAWTELHVVSDLGEHRPFVAGQVNVRSIAWSADGTGILFLAKRPGDANTSLYSISVGGGEAQIVAELETTISSYSLSPDGRHVALLAFEPEDTQRKKEKDLGFDQYVFEEEWQERRVYLVNLGDETSDPRMLNLGGSVQSVQWSPAGDRLAVAVTPRQLVDDTLMFQQLQIVSLDGELIGRINNPGKLGEFEWSPDGERLAFIAAETLNDTAAGRLMVSSKNGGAIRHLMPDLLGHVRAIDWHNNENVLFISHEGVQSRLGRIHESGENETTLIPSGGPIWSDFDVANDGRMSLVASTPQHPAEVFRFGNGGSIPERVTNSNPWLDNIDLARQEVVTYEARDGLPIEGMLVYPLNYQEGQQYPLILAVHGGPEAHYSNGWLSRYSLPAQHAAAEGYFMFFQNYRGSTGRGVEFALTSQGRPAMEEFDDLVDGVDYLINEGMVDGDKVGITGGSYGGYASAWGATYYSERFAAAVMFVGISEMFSKFGTTDIPQEMYLVHYGIWPWENWELFEAASPLRYVEKAQTPILIMHGDSDPRVDPRQSEILYRYLILQEDPPPARLVFYKGEGHGNLRAASRYDYSLRMMRWMNHYLKGAGGDPPPPSLDYELDLD